MFEINYIHDDVEAEISHVDDDTTFVGRNLCMLNKFSQILFRDAILGKNVEQDDADFVEIRHFSIKKDGHDIPHVILDFLSFSISTHSQILNKTSFKIGVH